MESRTIMITITIKTPTQTPVLKIAPIASHELNNSEDRTNKKNNFILSICLID